MSNPLLGSLAKDIRTAFKTTLSYSIRLITVTETTGGDGSISQSTSSSSGEGIVTEYSTYFKTQGLVPDGARKVVLFQESFSVVPKQNDRLTPLAGPFSGQTFEISDVTQDPAGATWECMALPWRA